MDLQGVGGDASSDGASSHGDDDDVADDDLGADDDDDNDEDIEDEEEEAEDDPEETGEFNKPKEGEALIGKEIEEQVYELYEPVSVSVSFSVSSN